VPITDSRLLNGTLEFGATATVMTFECQVTNAVVEQEDGDTDDTVTTLCGDTVGGGSAPGPWHITGTVIQDFDAAAATNITKWSYDNRGTEQAFTFTPNDTAGVPTITGTVFVKFLGIGGDVNARLTRDFDWGIDGEPVFTWPGGAGFDATTDTTEPVDEPVTDPELVDA
jgi:hypothetical protein